MFVMRQGGAFAGGADRDEAVRALRNLPFDQRTKGRLVNRAADEALYGAKREGRNRVSVGAMGA